MLRQWIKTGVKNDTGRNKKIKIMKQNRKTKIKHGNNVQEQKNKK